MLQVRRRVLRRFGVVCLALALTCAALASSAEGIAANGSFVRVGTAIYRVVGGAAIHVDSCTYLGGCPNYQQISSLAGYAAVPANGTLIEIADDAGWTGEIVGGALVHLDSCAPFNGCANRVVIDGGGASDYMRAHPLPAAGTFVRIENDAGWTGEVTTGGALLHLDSCAPFNGCAGVVVLDQVGGEVYQAAHSTAPDGSFLRAAGGPAAGFIGEVIGRAVIHVDSCAPLNGCAGDTNLDGGGLSDYMRAHSMPANGTFVKAAGGTQNGLVTRAAGGALLVISDCAPLGGCGGVETLDGGGFADWRQEHKTPADGTYLLGLPSNTTWEVLGGERQQVPANPAAVPVDDTSLAEIPVAPAPASTPPTAAATPNQTVGPRPVTAAKARHRVDVRFHFFWRWNRASSQLVWIKAPKLRRPMRMTARCHGTLCPYKLLRWRHGDAKRFLKRLTGRIYHAGDRLTLTVSARNKRSERITLHFRYGRLPVARLGR